MLELTDFGFIANYRLERLDVRPAGNVREFRHPRPGADVEGLVFETGTEYIWFEVSPVDGERWLGGFECGPGRLTGLFATPSPEIVCVVVKGQGFWVPVLAPWDYEIIRSLPIQRVLLVPRKKVLVFADYTGLEAFGGSGRLWLTERISWDGLKVTEITTDTICGMAWDSPANRSIPFSVDTESGIVRGGSSPAKYERG